jgi:hypothetical protein
MSFGQGFASSFGVVHGALARNQALAQQQVDTDRVDLENRLNRPYVEEQERANRERAGVQGAQGAQPSEQGFLTRLGRLLGISGEGTGGGGAAFTSDTRGTTGMDAPGRPPGDSSPPTPAYPPGPMPSPPTGAVTGSLPQPGRTPPAPPTDASPPAPRPQYNAPAQPTQGAQPSPAQGAQTARPSRVQEMTRGAEEGGQILAMVAELNGVRPDQVTANHWQRTYDIARNNMSAPMAQRTIEAMHKRQAEALAMGSARAMSAIERGDWDGASRALNALNFFAPDGHTDRFEPTGTGLRLTRTPDGGGEPQVINMTADQARASVMSAMDPQWWQTHVLNVRTQAERERSNRVGEAQRGAQIGLEDRRVGLAERAYTDARTDREADREADRELAAAYAESEANPGSQEARDRLTRAFANASTQALARIAGVQQAGERLDLRREENETRRQRAESETKLREARADRERAQADLTRATQEGNTEAARVARERLTQSERALDIAQQRADAFTSRTNAQNQPRPQTPLTPQQQEAMRGVFDTVFPEASANGRQAAPAPVRAMAMEAFGPLVQSNANLTVDAVAANMQRMFSLPPQQLLDAAVSGQFGMMVLPPEVRARIMLGARMAGGGGGGQGGGQDDQQPGVVARTTGAVSAIGRSLSDRWNWQNRMPQPPTGQAATPPPAANPPGRTGYDAATSGTARQGAVTSQVPRASQGARREPSQAEIMERAQQIARDRGLDLSAGSLAYEGNFRRRSIINEARAQLQSGG